MSRLTPKKGNVHNAMGGPPPSESIPAWRPHVRDTCVVRDCPAQAWVRTLHGEHESWLLWCAHHFHRNEIELIAEGCRIDDHRGTLLASERAHGFSVVRGQEGKP